MHRLEPKDCPVATILDRAWRASPPDLEVTAEDLAAAAPSLLESGAAALGWWRLRRFAEWPLPVVLRRLRAAYLRSAAQSVDHEREIVALFRALRTSGVDPILLKGWAIARAYPESGLRPSGDIDLCVSPDQYARTKAVLGAQQSSVYPVDLDHYAIARFSEFTFAGLYLRSQMVMLDGTPIRIPGAEDHLRIVCLHLLQHGSSRPLWLCDVAAALESRPQDFDWNLCLGSNKTCANWVLCALALSGRLIGAETKGTPAHQRVETLPDWLVNNVLTQWSVPRPPDLLPFVDQLRTHLWDRETRRAIRQRWPNPIRATVVAGRPFSHGPRLPFQIRDGILRTVRFARQAIRLWKPRR
jgi:hypothetical protein